MAKRKHNSSEQPRVYSYIRFSTSDQAEGDSERRQTEKAKAFASKSKMRFDDSLRLIDRGRSAFKGHHRSKGVLGPFLDAVKAGQIPVGSILYVENLDRLTRLEPIDAIEMIIFGLITNGISIALYDGTVYDRESLKRQIYRLISDIERAHEESKRKSELGRDNWQRKRTLAQEEGRPLTARRHAWIRVLKEGKALTDDEIKAGLARTGRGTITFDLVPEIAEAVRLIFQLKLEGMGQTRIVSRLNKEATWKPKNGWRQSYLRKILIDRAVIGEYQPHRMQDGKRVPDGDPIIDYYPAVVDRDTFNAVQQSMAKNRGKGGRTGKASSVFTHMIFCAYCGGAMHFSDKGKPPKGRTYLFCDQGKRGAGCSCRSIRYDEVEASVLTNCRRLDPERILPDPSGQAKVINQLNRRIEAKTNELCDLEASIGRYWNDLDNAKLSDAMRDNTRSRIMKLEDRKPAIERELREAEQELREAERDSKSVKRWTRSLGDLHRRLNEENDDIRIETRLRLRNHLRELIERIEVFTHGYTERAAEFETTPMPGGFKGEPRKKYPPRTKDDFANYLEDVGSETGWNNDPRFYDFVEWVMSLRQSRHGRFVRVHFKTGGRIDIVPEGSLASGRAMDPDGGYCQVTPDLNTLWKRYTKTHPKKDVKPKIRSRGKLISSSGGGGCRLRRR